MILLFENGLIVFNLGKVGCPVCTYFIFSLGREIKFVVLFISLHFTNVFPMTTVSLCRLTWFFCFTFTEYLFPAFITPN